MAALLTLPTALAVIGISGQLVAARRPLVGWTISVLAQPLWYAFYFSVGAYPLMVLSTGYAIAAVRLLCKELAARGLTFRAYPAFLVANTCAPFKGSSSTGRTDAGRHCSLAG